jgi:hypothetical protein
MTRTSRFRAELRSGVTAWRRWPLFALAPLYTSACAGQIGAAPGVSTLEAVPAPSNARFVWSNQATISTVLGMQRGPHVGIELESRSEYNVGSRWTTGLQLGYAFKPNSRPLSLGLEGYLEGGTRLRNQALFADGDWYGGFTVGLPIWAAQRHQVEEGGPEQWFVVRTAEIVPFVRIRWHFDHSLTDVEPVPMRRDAGAGIAIRLRLVSDFF